MPLPKQLLLFCLFFWRGESNVRPALCYSFIWRKKFFFFLLHLISNAKHLFTNSFARSPSCLKATMEEPNTRQNTQQDIFNSLTSPHQKSWNDRHYREPHLSHQPRPAPFHRLKKYRQCQSPGRRKPTKSRCRITKKTGLKNTPRKSNFTNSRISRGSTAKDPVLDCYRHKNQEIGWP